MNTNFSESYKDAGVDITAGYAAVELMKKHINRTKIPGVLSGIGGFGGLFEPCLGEMKRPVLVSGTDGVGTKLKLAFLMDKHDTVGIDCVAMCVNDVICAGASPLFFLDYIAVGKNIPGKIEKIISGIAEGCVQAECALIGGETAEMPGFYPADEYDVAGFSVGIVDYNNIIDGKWVKNGDIIIALPSSGVHSNGFSLIRKVFNVKKENISVYIDELSKTLGEELLTPTKIYVKPMKKVLEKFKIGAICHITGGGFYENVPRMLRNGLAARIFDEKVRIHPIFEVLSKTGNIPKNDMFGTFNMGVGMMFTISAKEADAAVKLLCENGENAYIIGEVTTGNKEVIFA